MHRLVSCFALVGLAMLAAPRAASQPATPAVLADLFADWRAFERPPQLDGAPDYTATRFEMRQPSYEALRTRLTAIDTTGWAVPHQVDWHIVWAEMNGYAFNRQVLKPWVRDPAFYQSIWMNRSDVPAHEGPTHHAVVELWTYSFPLTEAEEQRLTRELAVIPPLMRQARRNLTGNARELWVTGIRNLRQQRAHLETLRERLGPDASSSLLRVIGESEIATDELVAWLESEADSKTGPSGIGRDHYTWWQQNVHLVPMTWEDEVRLLQRELDRSWSSLKLEEHRNRNLPSLTLAATPDEMRVKADQSVQRFVTFLEEQDIVPMQDYFEPTLLDHRVQFAPEATRNFFLIGAHYDPLPLLTHMIHWIELERMDRNPHDSPVRATPLLYNLWDSRNEGTATGVEEMFMHAGLYDDSPRSRELVWILVAQRAARGLGSLYAHANEMTMEEAGQIHQDWTPRGWMKTERELLIFEQHLYLRQPGYGTSYITGKYLLEQTLADATQQAETRGRDLPLGQFFDRLFEIDSIPIALGRWEMTGHDAAIREITAAYQPLPAGP